MNRLGVSAGALLFALMAYAPAWAQPQQPPAEDAPAVDTPPPADDQRARELFQQGDEHYKSGRYREAVDALRKSYELSGREALLFNIANALEKLGLDEQALENLEAYAPHAPDDRKQEVADRIAALQARIEAAKPPPEPHPQPQPPVNAPPLPQPSQPRAPLPPAEPPADGTTPPTAVAGYALLGLGAVGIGLGAAFGAVALGARSDAEQSCDADSGLCLDAADDALEEDTRFSAAADVSFGIGIAAALAGGALVIHSVVVKPSQTARRTLTVALARGELRVISRF